MRQKQRYTQSTISPTAVAKLQRSFLKQAGPAMKLMWELSDSFPDIALTVKNNEGRIVFTNRFNASISGWSSPTDMIGYTSEELYPPDQAAIYGGRDREVFESGRPIVERLYGFVADRSTDLNCVTIRPVIALDGSRLGTATIYHRAKATMRPFNWYDPIRKSIAYVNENYAENIDRALGAAFKLLRRPVSQTLHQDDADVALAVHHASPHQRRQNLLRTTDRRIADIAAETGFCDHSHFIKIFRSATGQTPNEFRQLH